jgi:hypothetical protein
VVVAHGRTALQGQSSVKVHRLWVSDQHGGQATPNNKKPGSAKAGPGIHGDTCLL